MRKQKGFTLIELLVVIAIIGILAAMLFPVFARARESARKTQCLSNVKNIAMAFQMYFSDYDRFPPGEHEADVLAYWQERGCDPGCCSNQANPYLRWPVILDEYIKNRDVWRCPSAKGRVTYPQMIMPAIPTWFQNFKNGDYCACGHIWPSGWGGTVTDTDRTKDSCTSPGAGTGAPEFSIGIDESSLDQPLSTINDPARFIVCADTVNIPYWAVEQIAFATVCRVQWGNTCTPDFESDCGSSSCSIDDDQLKRFWTDASFRKQYARHMGGSNLGFSDGHARWMDADAIVKGVGDWRNPHPELDGVQCQCLPDAFSS